MALSVKKKYPLPRSTRPHHTLPQRMVKRQQRQASLRRATTAGMILSLLAFTAGIGYTWYMGQQKNVAATQAAPQYTPRATLKPAKIASDARVGVSMQTFTPEVKPGENASATIRTNPEVECAISVRYNNVAAVDSGLVTKAADEYGVASWAWTVPQGTPFGKWPIEVTCKNKKHSAVVKAEFLIK